MNNLAPKAPFPWPGGKSRVADVIWERFGDPDHYIEPFCGSLAVLLARPNQEPRLETVNDKDGLLVNFWRAVQWSPDEVARWAEWPLTEIDLRARRDWLESRRGTLSEKLQDDPEYHDAKTAGWWVWALGASINYPKHGTYMKSGQGIFSEAMRKNPNQSFRLLSKRLKHLRITIGDWTRTVRPSIHNNAAAVLLDPPYLGHQADYAEDDKAVAHEAARWAREHPHMKIALCGHPWDYDMPGWSEHHWQRNGGLGNQGSEARPRDECIWFSPACKPDPQGSLFP